MVGFDRGQSAKAVWAGKRAAQASEKVGTVRKKSENSALQMLTNGNEGGIIKEDFPFIHKDKITKYLLKPGAKHYKDFEKAGYTPDDTKQLESDILNGYQSNKKSDIVKSKDGTITFNVYMELGIAQKKRFCVGWQIDPGSNTPRLITAFRKDR